MEYLSILLLRQKFLCTKIFCLKNYPQLKIISTLFSWGFPLPHLFFQKLTDAQFEKIQQTLEQEDEKKEKILCKVCQHPITSHQKKIEINGLNQHVFRNPAGFFYEIVCFSSANGCINKGSSTLENTWFQGYSWRYALCSNCFAHLGWFFQSENDSFYGLILENLEEEY
ncbi:cereblon family protein [Candidatus Parabeggiatoa sp. HSG14]|uniref:cereblon family protein n=1 Tax=Candidatus Parabeggiatoa sp. HSG14 TaxID=3055593 RepID=UPI0025A6FC4B|nr:cereblon family protein [Thiotrichales bacterium HSG14]